jgi:hypothetical protein
MEEVSYGRLCYLKRSTKWFLHGPLKSLHPWESFLSNIVEEWSQVNNDMLKIILTRGQWRKWWRLYFFFFIHVFTCAYILWVISPSCPPSPRDYLCFEDALCLLFSILYIQKVTYFEGSFGIKCFISKIDFFNKIFTQNIL